MTEDNIFFPGEPLFSRGPDGRLRSRIATVFPHFDAIVTAPKPHAFQIEDFIGWLNQQRKANQLPRMSMEEEQEAREDAVACVIEGDCVQIRPDPQNMPLAFRADKLLQKRRVSKRQIKFLNVFNAHVRSALKRRGECWRMARLPTSRSEMKQRILAARTALRGREIYYYNATSGTRLLTCHEFARLGDLDDRELRSHLAEIAEFSRKANPQHNPEVAFYGVNESFTAETFTACDFASMTGAELRAVYEELKSSFCEAVPPELREDDLDDNEWRRQMFSALVAETEEVVQEEVLLSLSPEFFMQIQWLPGGRIVNGDLVFDEVFEEDDREACADNAREFLYNLVREYEDLEYVNIGQVVNSLSRRRPSRGRREVYVAVMKRYGHAKEIVSIIRMQKWGVREHLDEKRSVQDAMFRADEYTEYVLDRRFGCRYLGMNIPKRITPRKICERYLACWTGADGYMIWSPYFERAYVHGMATDKTPRERFRDPAFALEFARLLGRAAASNLIVGRCDADKNVPLDDDANHVLFDDGDEIVILDGSGMPQEIVVADQTGTFRDFSRPLEAAAAAYAEPILRRIDFLPDVEAFTLAYLDAFVERFAGIQEKYRSRRRAFHTLFKTRPYDDEGSFSHRWKRVLERLDRSDPRALAKIIQASLPAPVGC